MLEIVRIILRESRPAGDDDPLGRSWLGYDETRSGVENWEANRGAWKLNPQRIERCDFALFSHGGQIVLVAQISGVEQVPDAGGYTGRWSLLGNPLPGHRWEGAQTPGGRSFGSPITYLPIESMERG